MCLSVYLSLSVCLNCICICLPYMCPSVYLYLSVLHVSIYLSLSVCLTCVCLSIFICSVLSVCLCLSVLLVSVCLTARPFLIPDAGPQFKSLFFVSVCLSLSVCLTFVCPTTLIHFEQYIQYTQHIHTYIHTYIHRQGEGDKHTCMQGRESGLNDTSRRFNSQTHTYTYIYIHAGKGKRP